MNDADGADSTALVRLSAQPRWRRGRRRVPSRSQEGSVPAQGVRHSGSRATRTSQCATSRTASPAKSVLTPGPASHAPVPEAEKMTTGRSRLEDALEAGQDDVAARRNGCDGRSSAPRIRAQTRPGNIRRAQVFAESGGRGNACSIVPLKLRKRWNRIAGETSQQKREVVRRARKRHDMRAHRNLESRRADRNVERGDAAIFTEAGERFAWSCGPAGHRPSRYDPVGLLGGRPGQRRGRAVRTRSSLGRVPATSRRMRRLASSAPSNLCRTFSFHPPPLRARSRRNFLVTRIFSHKPCHAGARDNLPDMRRDVRIEENCCPRERHV